MPLTAAAVLVGLLSGAWVSWRIETWIGRRIVEKGPASPVGSRRDLLPSMADRWLYPAGPLSALFGIALAAAVVPLSPTWIGADLGIGVFYFIVVVDFTVLGLAMGGWGANSAHGAEVYYRAVAQLVSYVVPLGLAYIGAIMMAQSLSTVKIIEAQSGLWFIVLQPIGFALYLATGLMQCFRRPFMESFADAIDHGVLGLYGAWKLWVWRMAFFALLFLVSAMGAVLYLGGWQGPWLPGPVWMVLKTLAMMALLVSIGTRLRPRDTYAMLQFSWKVLTPVGLLNVLIVGGLILLGVGVK